MMDQLIYRVLCGLCALETVGADAQERIPSLHPDPKVLLVNPELRIRTFAYLLDVVLDLYQACVGYWLDSRRVSGGPVRARSWRVGNERFVDDGFRIHSGALQLRTRSTSGRAAFVPVAPKVTTQ